jgi:hypothetical protein
MGIPVACYQKSKSNQSSYETGVLCSEDTCYNSKIDFRHYGLFWQFVEPLRTYILGMCFAICCVAYVLQLLAPLLLDLFFQTPNYPAMLLHCLCALTYFCSE